MPSRVRYQAQKEHYRNYNRKFLADWRKENPDKKPHSKEYLDAYRKRPEVIRKEKVRMVTTKFIRTGILKRDNCEMTGCTIIGEAHHDDYDKPLDIRWLCKRHHEDYHHNL